MRRIIGRGVVACALGILLAGGTLYAHHSFAAQFDPAKPFAITGAVTKVEWTSPHIYFYVDVKNASGAVANWAVELANPLALLRLGWTRNDVKVGDSIRVEGWLARDGSKLMNARTVVVGGRKMFAGSSQASTP